MKTLKEYKFRIWDAKQNMSEVGLKAKSEKEALYIIEEEEGDLSRWERIKRFTSFPSSLPHA